MWLGCYHKLLIRQSLCLSSSGIDALHSLILRVKGGFEVSLGLVGHAHPFQGELTTLDEIRTHLRREGGKDIR